MRIRLSILGPLFFLFTTINLSAQFVPVPVTGFNQDVIAEGGPSSFATTSIALDAGGSNKVMYSTTFAAFAGITAGLPSNGTLTVGADNYQLASFTSNNSLFIFQGQSLDLNLTTPASFAKLRLVCFSTEGPSIVNISVSFTDGTTVNYISNYNLPDWFFGTSNIIVQGFGRVSRTVTGPWPADGLPSNPKIYYIEIPLLCADISKQVQKITCSNITVAGNNPFPNTVLLGLSGIPYSRNVSPVITPANCSGTNGSISLTVTGSGAPYSYVWNTTPVQTGPVATGLAPGTYTCTITDASGCISTYTGVVPLNNNSAMSATATPSVICPGTPVQLNAVVGTGPLTSFTWNPGNLSGASVTVSPAATTTYTVNGSNSIGCTATTTVTVTVNPVPAAPVANNATICSGGTATLQIVSPQPGQTYNWYNSATGGTILGTGTNFITPVLTSTTTYYVDAVSAAGCISNARTAVTVLVNPLPAVPSANDVSVCSGSNAILNVVNPQPGAIYSWYAVATGGTALGTGNSYTVNNVTAATTIYLESSVTGCTSASRDPVAITLTPQLPAPVVTVTNSTISSLTFSWTAVTGATGYEVSTNGGASFQTPSSGPNGTTHTITGLAGNTTITLEVRALGVQVCETSLLSLPVKGTTLSTKEVFVPNVFTPNGDGKNDVLFVYGNYISSMQFHVFNQWGQLIFSSDNITLGWTGTYFGVQQPVGVYAYTLRAVLQDGTVVNKKGSINLVR